MNTLKSIAHIVVILGAFATSAHAGSQPSSEYLGLVRATANDICTGIEDLDTNRSRLKVAGEVQAGIDGFFGDLIHIPNINVAAEYETESGTGLLATQILSAIDAGVVQGDKCKLKVFKTLLSLPILE